MFDWKCLYQPQGTVLRFSCDFARPPKSSIWDLGLNILYIALFLLSSQLIADPNDEEELAASVVTVVTLDDGKICSTSKPGMSN